MGIYAISKNWTKGLVFQFPKKDNLNWWVITLHSIWARFSVVSSWEGFIYVKLKQEQVGFHKNQEAV